jgi:hypothetical protein
MDYVIEKINGDNWRPGMPKEGYLVRYGTLPSGGWKYMKTFENIDKAQKFIES